MDTKDKSTVSIGCKVALYCLTDGEHYEYKIIKSRDTTEFTPKFGGYYENQNYDSKAKIAEYAEEELGDDRPLAKELIGKKCGETVKVFSYTYQIEDISFHDEYKIEPIMDFISSVYSDFNNYINGNNKLCDLKSAGFYSDNFPVYPNKHIQQVYLLRYCLAYAYEYKQMYETVMCRNKFSSQIKVTSFGCGSMIDYWSLAEILKKRGNLTIDYTGIDLAKWHYTIGTRDCDTVQSVQKDVIDWLSGTICLSSDIFIFPKSISEFKDDVFDKICAEFQNKRFLKDKFHVMITLRYDPHNDKVNENDLNKSIKIYNAIKANGFSCGDDPNGTLPAVKIDRCIWDADNELCFPQEFDWTLLKYLSEKCCASSEEKARCRYGCETIINRVPMLSTKYACYQIFTFYREKQK